MRKQALVGTVVLGSFLSGGLALGQLVVPSSHPNATLTAPTSSILLNPTDVNGLKTWWASPAAGDQTTIKNSVNSIANQSLTLAVPGDLTDTANQSSIVYARALRWVLAGNGANQLHHQPAFPTPITRL